MYLLPQGLTRKTGYTEINPKWEGESSIEAAPMPPAIPLSANAIAPEPKWGGTRTTGRIPCAMGYYRPNQAFDRGAIRGRLSGLGQSAVTNAFSIIPTWAWIAGGAAALLLFAVPNKRYAAHKRRKRRKKASSGSGLLGGLGI
ncbi:MAG TPA: hypothetical protein VNJ12_13215 [Candidatus Dormibacteraeota bacterium]|nr:hypothetical protein [Candidatus Dormibacteraeota bacterium]